jgi:hypothetical protein
MAVPMSIAPQKKIIGGLRALRTLRTESAVPVSVEPVAAFNGQAGRVPAMGLQVGHETLISAPLSPFRPFPTT